MASILFSLLGRWPKKWQATPQQEKLYEDPRRRRL
jgi:hypothetical protein